MRLSIVVPAYNAAPFLERCIRSLEGQDVAREDYEIIIVDDGSTDETPLIAAGLYREFGNIRILTQTNKGLSVARNEGIAHAEGEYLMFVDSDDALRPACLAAILERCESQDLDLLRIGAVGAGSAAVCSGLDVLRGRVKVCAPFSVCRKSLLDEHQLRFFPGIFHEDAEFTPRLYYYAKRVSSLPEDVYIVNRTPGSITGTPDPKRVHDLLLVMDRLDAFAAGLPGGERKAFHDCISSNMNYALHLATDFSVAGSDLRRNFAQAFAGCSKLFLHLRASSRFRWKMEGLLFGLFPRRALGIYSFFYRFVKPDPDA